jgi:hypothetical protein
MHAPTSSELAGFVAVATRYGYAPGAADSSHYSRRSFSSASAVGLSGSA